MVFTNDFESFMSNTNELAEEVSRNCIGNSGNNESAKEFIENAEKLLNDNLKTFDRLAIKETNLVNVLKNRYNLSSEEIKKIKNGENNSFGKRRVIRRSRRLQ